MAEKSKIDRLKRELETKELQAKIIAEELKIEELGGKLNIEKLKAQQIEAPKGTR